MKAIYIYTTDGKPLRTTYAGGRWRENAYNARRELVSTEYSDGEACAFAYDEFSREAMASNGIAAVVLLRNDRGQVTNETATVGSCVPHGRAIERRFDAFGRLVGNDGLEYAYAPDGQLAAISNSIASVEYRYTPDRLDAGYTLALSNGATVTRSLVRDTYRRSLVAGITNSVNSVEVENLAYSYDALDRPVSRNADTFGYNYRSEVTSATVSGIATGYGYDEIGNSTSYTPNSLNQYTEFAYDLDGNLLTDWNLAFTYDAANRLKTVSTNGVLLLTNFYDAKARRVKKVTQEATTTFFYDDWNLIEERVAYTNGTSSTIRYYWGKDISGTLQGAGGVGGLLFLTVDGAVYVPFYDNIGNVTRYVDENGNTVAQYTYDAFGKLISKSGPLADFFRHRFSTKYFDSESGLYYYGYRYYHPVLMRWLNRDPIEEEGGLDLYDFCGIAPLHSVDALGMVKFKIPNDDYFNDISNRKMFRLRKFVDVRKTDIMYENTWGDFFSFPSQRKELKEYSWKVNFIARFTPPAQISVHRGPSLSGGNALGGYEEMFTPQDPRENVSANVWGTPEVSPPERSVANYITRQRYHYSNKMFRFGYVAYKANISDGIFTKTDSNPDMYSTWNNYAA